MSAVLAVPVTHTDYLAAQLADEPFGCVLSDVSKALDRSNGLGGINLQAFHGLPDIIGHTKTGGFRPPK